MGRFNFLLWFNLQKCLRFLLNPGNTLSFLIWCLSLLLLSHAQIFANVNGRLTLWTWISNMLESEHIWSLERRHFFQIIISFLWYLDQNLVSNMLVSWFDNTQRCASRSRSLFLHVDVYVILLFKLAYWIGPVCQECFLVS